MGDGRYPNHVREARLGAFLTRKQLAERCAVLARKNPEDYVALSARSLEHIERGSNQPRIRTAVTLAAALDRSPADLFPNGVDDGIRNRTGKTTIPVGRRKRGKGKARSNPDSPSQSKPD